MGRVQTHFSHSGPETFPGGVTSNEIQMGLVWILVNGTPMGTELGNKDIKASRFSLNHGEPGCHNQRIATIPQTLLADRIC